jgi:hypothetical protein
MRTRTASADGGLPAPCWRSGAARIIGYLVHRYGFGTRSSEFLTCGDCGVYLAALLTSSKGPFATLNINTMRASPNAPEAVPVSYDEESIEQRRPRREQRWTPVAEAV